MTLSTTAPETSSQASQSYLVATANAFGSYIEFGDDHHVYDMDDCFCGIGWFEAKSPCEAIDKAIDLLLAEGCTQEYLGRLQLRAFLYAPIY